MSNILPTEMIVTQGLTKQFKKTTAVDRLTFSINAGEVFGFLGPNGAGKTTTVRMLGALISPTSGKAWVNGKKIGDQDHAIRRSIGILTEAPGLYDALSAQRNLKFYATMYEVEETDAQIERYLRMLGLWKRRHESVSTFSKGMRQKLAIARALLHEPKILFLDEPTSGLDPEMARLVRNFISELKSEGRTIVLCTHNLDEADRLCDRIAIIKSHLLALDTPETLRQKLYGRTVVFHLGQDAHQFESSITDFPFVNKTQAHQNKIVVELDDPEDNNPAIIRQLIESGADIQFVGEIRRSLEDIYLQFINASEQ